MRAGTLRKRIEIQAATAGKNDLGEPTLTWRTVDRWWAEVKPLAGREAFDARQVMAEVSHQITIRYRRDTTPENRIAYGSRVFEVLSVIDVDERHDEMRLLCKEHIRA